MQPVLYDRYYGYDELTALLRSWADEAPGLCTLDSIGRSWEGRDIWLVTLTNEETGPHPEKPAFLVEAQIHSMEWTGTTAALHLVHKLLSGHGSDERVTRALDTRCFYVIPRLNPDGAEAGLRERRFIRSSLRPWPRLDRPDGLRPEDLDGDGRVLWMRIEDEDGAWKPHPDDPRLIVRREPLDEEGPFYRLLPEGRISNYDGATIRLAEPYEGLDLNRNFPADWAQEVEQRGAGPYPVSEPETRAMVQAVVDRPNITGHIAYHTFSGVHLRPYAGRPDDELPTFDLRAFTLIGENATRITGYPAMSVFHGFKYDPKESLHGGAHDWLYEHVGVFAWTTEFWAPPREAGIEGYRPIDWLQDHPPEDDLKLMRWNEENWGGRAYADWYPFDHPELGPVELGGWDVIHYWFNVPFERLEAEVAPHSELAIFHALVSPRLESHSLDVESVGEGAYRVRWIVKNTGWLPTNVTQKAVERKVVRPLELELTLPEGAALVTGEPKVEAGQLVGRVHKRSPLWWGNDDGTHDRAKAEWVVQATAGTELALEARHQRAGVVRERVTLP